MRTRNHQCGSPARTRKTQALEEETRRSDTVDSRSLSEIAAAILAACCAAALLQIYSERISLVRGDMGKRFDSDFQVQSSIFKRLGLF